MLEPLSVESEVAFAVFAVARPERVVDNDVPPRVSAGVLIVDPTVNVPAEIALVVDPRAANIAYGMEPTPVELSSVMAALLFVVAVDIVPSLVARSLPASEMLGADTASPCLCAAIPFTSTEANRPDDPEIVPCAVVMSPSMLTSPCESTVRPRAVASDVPVFRVSWFVARMSSGAKLSMTASPVGGFKSSGPVIVPPVTGK